MTTTPASIRIIRDEHQALRAMLDSLRLMLRRQREQGTAPRFDVIRAMLFYIDEFPERLHHRKESELLFPLIRQHSDTAADILDRLDRDHGAGERAIRDLERALLAWEMIGESRRIDFESSQTAISTSTPRTCAWRKRWCCRWRCRCSARRNGASSTPPSPRTATR